MNNTPINENGEEKSIGKEKKPLSKKMLIRIVSIALAAVLAVLAIVLPVTLTQCGKTKSIKVTSRGGLGLAEVSVTVYDGENVTASGSTDENGVFAVDLGKKDYTVKLDNLPDGFKPESAYKVTGGQKEIVIAVHSEIVQAEIPANKIFRVGDVMYDFTLQNAYIYDANATSMTPKTVSLANLAQDKKCIILNFFFTTCGPCKAEIPAMLEAYHERSEQNDVLILGVSNYATDTDALVAAFVKDTKADYYMGMDTAGIISRFPNVNAFPTTIIIDRYGVISVRHTNSEPTVEFWRNVMQTYTSDDYVNTPVNPDEDEGFVPDKPADFGVEFTKNPQEISDRINKTGVNVTFSADASEASWPWKLADDGESIIPTNSGHMRTPAIIYAELNVTTADTVVTFDYRMSCVKEKDYFYVAVDGKRGMGHQTIKDSGVEGWKDGYAFISLEPGRHDIAFMFYKGSDNEASKATEDTVYVKNLRLEKLSDVLAKGLETDMPYFAARAKNTSGGYDVYESVSLGDDGFYYLDGHVSSAGDRPMLYCALTEATPFFTSPTASIYSEYIAKNNCVFNGKNYYDLLRSFNSWASSSTVGNLVPVTRDLQRALDAMYKSVVPASAPYYSENGWLEFCAFYKHFGPGESLGNPIEGLAYFTAIKAHETTGEADTGNLNSFEFNRIIMPRGVLFEFVPEKSGVYNVKGIGKLGCDGAIFDETLSSSGLSHIYVDPVNDCSSDYHPRNLGENYDYDNTTFNIYHYMEKGRTYYIEIAYSQVEQFGTLSFRIDYMNTQHYEYLTTATAGYLVIGENNRYVRPIFTNVEYDTVQDVYVDARLKKPIYCDFTDNSRMFNLYSIGVLLGKKGTQTFKRKAFDFRREIGKDSENKPIYEEYSIVIDGVTYECKDYTAIMEKYYDESVLNSGELYGMHEVDKTLHDILVLFYHLNNGFDDFNEWLTACYFFDYTDAVKPSPNTIIGKD